MGLGIALFVVSFYLVLYGLKYLIAICKKVSISLCILEVRIWRFQRFIMVYNGWGMYGCPYSCSFNNGQEYFPPCCFNNKWRVL